MTSGAPPTVQETHSAILFGVGDRVYKMKKPMDLGFLDFTTREAREAVCHRELALNRRLSPDVYLGVDDVYDETGAPCEHLLVMRRMPQDKAPRSLRGRRGRRSGDGVSVRAVAVGAPPRHGPGPCLGRGRGASPPRHRGRPHRDLRPGP